MRPRRAIAALSAALTFALAGAGCGSGAGPAPKPSGSAVFSQECSSCHTLSRGYDPRRQGGSLLRLSASRAQLRQFTSEMPVRHPLDHAQLEAVVDYVLAVERRAARGQR